MKIEISHTSNSVITIIIADMKIKIDINTYHEKEWLYAENSGKRAILKTKRIKKIDNKYVTLNVAPTRTWIDPNIAIGKDYFFEMPYDWTPKKGQPYYEK